MRNLKKFLALVLALMMTFSLMVTANAAIDTNAAVTDKDSITEEFKEAVAVLNGLKIITGYEDGTFRPDKSISRQEATALVYRLHSGDADNVKNNLYSTADNIAKFKDVNPNGAQQWSAGYIGYCANQEIIKGVNASRDRFNPTGNVTGYQMLAMVLRAIGYGQKGEYEGDGWQTRVATTATQLGMLKNIDDTNYAGTLSAPATRELVAEIVFQAALLKQVIWNDAFGYVSKNQITGLELKSLGVEKFNLNCGNYTVIDKWGRPGYQWFKGSSPIATIKAQPVKTYDTTVRECDVAHDLGIATNATYSLYVNRNTAITNNYRIEATDTVTKVGGQGRVTEFYGDLTNPHVAGDTWSKSVVMIDTYLATVTKVTERVVDPAGHVIVPAYLYLDVHDGQAVGAADKTDKYESTAKDTIGFPNGDTVTRNTSEHVASNKDANWEYAVGDKLLIQGYTDYTQRDAEIDISTGKAPVAPATGIDNGSGLNHLFNNSVEAANKAAFETNILGTDDSKINIVQKSNPVLGKQTVTYWNQGKHTVDGKDYNDAMTLFLDVAGTTTNTTFAWYFDTKGNLIGIDNVPNTVNYGVITSIWTSFNQGETNTDGTAKTYAKVLYADGTEATITIDRFLVTNTANTAVNAGGHVAPTTAGTTGAALSITTTTGNTAELIPAYDYNAGNANTMSGATRSGTAKDASQAGYLHVAPVASINDAQDANTGTSKFGIIKGNLFKFEASANGETTVIEVAGDGTNAGKFVGHYYTINNDNSAANKTGKLFKNLGCMSVDGGSNAFAWLDSNTRIMLNDGSADEKVSCYTLSTLPGDVLIKASSEIDWADTNNDGRVDVVYLTGTIEGTTTYNLFYYNGGAAQWNGADKKGTLFGWLNGEPATVTFDDEAELNAVKNSQGYVGHLFALQMTNGVVSNVMGVNQAGANDPDIYLLVPTAGTAISIGTADVVNTTDGNLSYLANSATPVAGISFKTGKADGNPYTATTEAVYIADVAPATTTQSVSYNPDTRTIIDWTDANGDGIMQVGEVNDTYYLVPNSKVIGLGMGVNQESAILDYLNKSTTNDVTIVYEITGGNMKSIVEIYVATDPNVTPGGEVTVDPGKPGYGVTALTNISGGISDANLTAAIKGVGPNSVVYSPYAKTNAAGVSDADEFLYFPFVGEASDTTGAALTIYKDGVPVFQENESNTVVGAKYFVINFASGTSSNATITSGPLTAGTYTFKIVSNGTGKTLSSGTFVMN